MLSAGTPPRARVVPTLAPQLGRVEEGRGAVKVLSTQNVSLRKVVISSSDMPARAIVDVVAGREVWWLLTPPGR